MSSRARRRSLVIVRPNDQPQPRERVPSINELFQILSLIAAMVINGKPAKAISPRVLDVDSKELDAA